MDVEWRKVVVRILLSVAGALAATLVIFVAIPWLLVFLEPGPEVEMTDEEIVRQALDSLAEEIVDRALEEEAAPGEETAAPLLATQENGEPIPVVFPRQEEETEEAVVALPGPVSEQQAAQDAAHAPPQSVVPGQMDAVIPVASLAPEAPAMPEPPDQTVPPAPVLVATAHEGVSKQAPQQVSAARATVDRTTLDRARTAVGPSPGTVGEVQRLLERLGYAPGPVDGVWGRKTERAWRAFMRDAGQAAGSLALAPSLGAEDPAQPGPVQAGEAEVRLPEPEASAVVPGTLRGVMGYRLPLVSRQEVPDQVVSGVLMPAHTTFVILRPGYWELTGLTPEEVQVLERAAARLKAQKRPLPAAPPVLPPGYNWTLLRMLGLERPAAAAQKGKAGRGRVVTPK